MFLWKNDQNVEKPIEFFSKVLRDRELKYDIMEKQVYVVVQLLKDFRVYVLHSHIITYVPSSVVKGISCNLIWKGKEQNGLLCY